MNIVGTAILLIITLLLVPVISYFTGTSLGPVETAALDPDRVRLGDRVWVERLRSVADVVEGPARGKVRVSAGMMKLWVDVADLRALKQAPAPPTREPTEVSGAHPKPELSPKVKPKTQLKPSIKPTK